jgi:hypothetical protein
MTWWVSTLRLASILAALGLVTTRVGLVLHEWAGHGGVAALNGATIEKVRLFWFGGGWIDYDLPKDASLAAHVASTMGGIGIEIVLGMIVWCALWRRTSLVAKLVRACAAAFVIHAAWYLAVGTYHGFGDGTIVRFVAGDTKRYLIALPAGAVVLAMTYFGARQIMGVLASTIPTRRTSPTSTSAPSRTCKTFIATKVSCMRRWVRSPSCAGDAASVRRLANASPSPYPSCRPSSAVTTRATCRWWRSC